ncbi:TIM barrel protein [Sphingomonas naphthae]|uniref:TIM barrel protein n=1 Tax=Sphingomonas naphthae TaxID=1813468 RepID=A0ABY7TQL7_9SPHN|nr:2-oxo-tetronate isomerase [Sphingomonas naphthae]WCT74139.1 TIM barrel protein [Sphingomonas naphthae]
MPKLAANLTMMFTELPFADRFAAAGAAGFKGIECLAPYELPIETFKAALEGSGARMVLFNCPPGNWAAGDRGMAADPERVAEFRASFDAALAYAAAVDCPRLHVMSGLVRPGEDRARWIDTYVANLAYAADRVASLDVDLLIEPINSRVDMPRYLVDRTDLAMEIIGRVGSAKVRLQYDIYHMQIMEGDLLRSIERLLPHIGHIQLADNPGRNEPGTGEINYAHILPALDRLGYDGWVGCEYRPAGETLAGLGWAKDFI